MQITNQGAAGAAAPRVPAPSAADASPAPLPPPNVFAGPGVALSGVPGAGAGLGVPQTGEQVAALRRHRSEVSDQLTSVQHRRDELSKQLRDPMVSGADRAGIEQRLTVVDARIVNLEHDLDATGQLIAAAPTVLLTTSRGAPDLHPRRGPFEAGFAAGAGLMFCAALLYTRLFHRRRPAVAAPSASTTADSARLARVEQAVEAVAIEVERIAEGQRFVTQLLATQSEHGRLAAPALVHGAER